MMKHVCLKYKGGNVHRIVEHLFSFLKLPITSGESHYSLDMFGLKSKNISGDIPTKNLSETTEILVTLIPQPCHRPLQQGLDIIPLSDQSLSDQRKPRRLRGGEHVRCQGFVRLVVS